MYQKTKNMFRTLTYMGVMSVVLWCSTACNSSKNTQTSGEATHFGKTIDAQNAQSVDAAVTQMQRQQVSELRTKIKGTVEEVCQAKGCWMTLARQQADPMRVKFKDYAFFMPKDLSGKTVVVEGVAKMETISVEMLRHYAEDAGKTADEIAQITEPQTAVSFMADGVVIVK